MVGRAYKLSKVEPWPYQPCLAPKTLISSKGGGHIGSPLRPGSHSACEILVSAKHPHISRASPQGQVAKNCFLSPKAGGLPAVPVGRGTAGWG